MAMENPPLWWYLPGNMGIFMGYVSFREGTLINFHIHGMEGPLPNIKYMLNFVKRQRYQKVDFEVPELLFPVWPAWCCHVQAVNGLDPFATLELYRNYSPFERLAPAEVSGTLSSSMSCPSCETKCSAKDSLQDRWGPKMAALILGIFIHPPNNSKYRTACITPQSIKSIHIFSFLWT